MINLDNFPSSADRDKFRFFSIFKDSLAVFILYRRPPKLHEASPDYRGDLNVEGEVGVDLAVLVVDDALVESGILGSRILRDNRTVIERLRQLRMLGIGFRKAKRVW